MIMTTFCKFLLRINVISKGRGELVSASNGLAFGLHGFLSASEQHLWLKKQSPYPQDIAESLMMQACMLECIQVSAAKIPSLMEKPIETVTLHISAKEYYLDTIAKELGLEDASYVLISRNVGKASSETRLFYAASRSFFLDQSSDLVNVNETLHLEGSLNVRASYLSGQCIFGDSMLASIGYTWKSKDLFYEDITAQSYYRHPDLQMRLLLVCCIISTLYFLLNTTKSANLRDQNKLNMSICPAHLL